MKLPQTVIDISLQITLLLERRLLLVLFVAISLYYGLNSSYVMEYSLPPNIPITVNSGIKIPYEIGYADNVFSGFPSLTAGSVLVVDMKTTRILYQKNIHRQLAPASTTKLLTALISQDLYDLTERLETPKKCIDVEGNTLSLSLSEKLSVEDLLHALLISSYNDAACILANNATTEEEFVALMNNKAQKLGMTESHFTNPVGFDSYDFSNYSTAKDLYILARHVRADTSLRSIYSKDKFTLNSGDYSRDIYSTNQLLSQLEGSIGIKTGTTGQAGEVLIYEYADNNRDLLIILMGSASRFQEIRAILNWIDSTYVWL